MLLRSTFFALVLSVSQGFLITNRARGHLPTSRRSSEESASDDNTISALESLFSLEVSEKATADDSELLDAATTIQARVSSTRRRRAEREKALLEMLATPSHEEAVELLWKHWYSERGEGPRDLLIELENLIASNNPKLLLKAEAVLNELVEEYEDWAEPYNRLAIIRYIQNRHEDSGKFCEKVLEMKPWHFGARSGLAMCWQKLGKSDLAMREAQLSLPPPGKFKDSNGGAIEPRRAWVKKMLAEIELRQKFKL